MADKNTEFEELSALADGELDNSATRFLLRRLERENNHELRDKWERYHLAGDVMRGDAELNLDGFADSVMSAITCESQDAATGGVDVSDNQSGWVWPAITGAAVAACAVMAVMLFQNTGAQQVAPEMVATQSPASAPTALAVKTPNLDHGGLSGAESPFKTVSAPFSAPKNESPAPSQAGQPVNTGAKPPMMVVYRRVPATHWEETPLAVQKRLNAYLINHNEFSAASLRQGPMQYGRLVSYDSKSDK